jgi:ABC-type lipoprotein release transport system permease subunit
VTPAVFVYAVAIALVLALLASAAPAWRVSNVRPAEVLRYE